MASGSSSSVAFGALGTLLGYVGAEVASDSIFSRLLWPQRFYNSHHPMTLMALAALMPMGGPIHKAALAVLDQLIASGLDKGYCRGDMLGTAFYDDLKQSYTLRKGEENDDELQKEVRNGLWIRAMKLVRWQADEDLVARQPSEGDRRDEEAAQRVTALRAKRPVMWLRLDYDSGHQDRDQTPLQARNQGRARSSAIQPANRSSLEPSVQEDSRILRSRLLLGILMSEMVSLGVGIFIAAYWRSPFSIWFISPLLVKVLALIFSVRRQALESSPELRVIEQEPGAAQDVIISELSDVSKGFFLTEGPRHLVMQFYKHYGHPERYRRGLYGDRLREVVSLALVVTCILIFPVGLVAFVFAPQAVQWTWLGYQLYTTLAMHLFRFVDGGTIGSTESELARALQKGKPVRFSDSKGNTIRALLDLKIAKSIADGRLEIEKRLKKTLR